MRFMVLAKATVESEAGQLPSTEAMVAMGRYNEELVKAGVLLAGDGLQPSAKGARVLFDGDDRTVVDGPFAETKELIAGYTILEVASKEEAVEWVKRCPNLMPGQVGEVEIRQIFEAADFAEVATDEVAAFADGVGELGRANVAKWRAEVAAQEQGES
ncbi:YciI family protein [Actinokineospora inagensis]|uniref:YciI family protein n=1 Tax=Actinokineospora inagensis TaxID=103730 RepID=UPI00047AA3B8|nr:YciI family protein [Actinokineospora inagensis]